MKKRWTDNLSASVHDRLCACRTIKADLPELVNAKYLSYKEAGKSLDKEDALIAVLELLDCNSCYFELTKEEYQTLSL